MAKVEDILNVATRELGTKEYPPNSNLVKYNHWFYGKDVSAPWCATFVSWVFNEAKAPLFPKSASCMTIGNYFKANNRFYKDNPQVGDLVFFKYSTNNRWTNHIGIVESVNPNGSINTIEGNTSFGTAGSQDNGGCVAARVRRSNIVGYGRPAYQDAVVQRPTLKKGSKGAYVKELQMLLVKHGFILDIDGDFGNITKQKVIEFQGMAGLVKDGIVGAKTWDKLGRL